VPAEDPPRREVRQDGWGYSDTAFELNKDRVVELTGKRYPFSGMQFPNFVPWVEGSTGINIDNRVNNTTDLNDAPPPRRNEEFLEGIRGAFNRISFDNKDRNFHGHGHTCQEIHALRFGRLHRVPDVVVWPGSHEDVERIVQQAALHNVCVIPYGGGTSVSGALECPHDEQRMIVSLDMQCMNNILWVDHKNMLMCAQAGIMGQDLQRRLEAQGVTTGHEPDSSEFSTLGGWVSTRASGMKKNIYGNIEDLLVSVKLVTPQGTLEKGSLVPRISAGPDLHQIVMGSEGTLGVITEVVLKVRALPPARAYGSVLFPNFESGVAFMREVARRRAAPASIRLVDNEQFQFGLALKPGGASAFTLAFDAAKKFYVTKIKGFEPTKMCVATLLFEGDADTVKRQQAEVFAIAAQFRGMNAGPDNGFRGYFLTYVIAYLRDFGFNYNFIAESFETSITWDAVLPMCEGVKRRIFESCAAHGVKSTPFVSCRVTQTYDCGAAVYFYFGFEHAELKDPVGAFTAVENDARDEIMAHGGSISHHHGVGKHRRQWMQETVSATGVHLLKGIKDTLDPQNVFGNGNLIPS